MLIHPYRDSLADLNFDNHEDLRYILTLDKHTRIEGLCSEAVFMEDIVEGNLTPVTSDYWFILFREEYAVMKVMTADDQVLSELDHIVLDWLVDSPGTIRTGVVRFNSAAKEFWAYTYTKGKLREEGKMWPLNRTAEISDPEHRDPERIRKATAFLEDRGILRDAAIKRIFANCFLPSGGVWDLDVITMAGTIPVALEVKHKYPTANKEFGVNEKQGGLFRYLRRAGIPVIHVILEKPVPDKSLSAIDLVTMPKYVKKTRWLYKPLELHLLNGPVTMAPASTAIHAGAEVPYVAIDEKEFRVLKMLYEKDLHVAEKLLGGIGPMH